MTRARTVRPIFGVLLTLAVVTLTSAFWPGALSGHADETTPSSPAAPTAVLGPAAPIRAVTQGAKPAPKALAARIAAIPLTDVGTVSGVVLDAQSGEQLFGLRATTPLLPASNLKILTATAALQLIDPTTTFSTRVVRSSAGSIVLVGGGDPLLAAKAAPGAYPRPASLQELATLTARALKQEGTTKVTLGFDDSLFTGPAWHPSWPTRYQSDVAPITALSADRGRARGAMQPDPSAAAGAAFAAELKANGIAVTGKVARTKAPAGAEEVASVTSPPLEAAVEVALLHSDNVVTEILARHAALAAGQPGSFAGGVKAVTTTLAGLGVPLESVTMDDGSGLSRSNRVPTAVLARVLDAVVRNDRFSAVRAGLPVAGATGSLMNRLRAPEARPGEGWVHAKTGTLTEVSSLSGFTRTADGRDVVFSFITNGGKDLAMRAWLDRATAVVSACGC